MPIYPAGIGQFARWSQMRGLVLPASAAVTALSLPATYGNWAETPDSVANSVTGDVDIVAKIAPVDWTPGVGLNQYIVAKGGNNTYGYFLYIRPTTGNLFFWCDNNSTFPTAESTAAPGFTDGTAHWVRATRASATGDVNFYTSEDGSSWAQLGTTVAAASGAIADTDEPLWVGQDGVSGSGNLFEGDIHYVEIRNGIDGTPVAVFDPSTVTKLGTRNPTTLVASTGETWTVDGSAWDWV